MYEGSNENYICGELKNKLGELDVWLLGIIQIKKMIWCKKKESNPSWEALFYELLIDYLMLLQELRSHKISHQISF